MIVLGENVSIHLLGAFEVSGAQGTFRAIAGLFVV